MTHVVVRSSFEGKRFYKNHLRLLAEKRISVMIIQSVSYFCSEQGTVNKKKSHGIHPVPKMDVMRCAKVIDLPDLIQRS